MTFMDITNLWIARPPRSHDYGLRLHLQPPTFKAFNCIFKIEPLWQPRVDDHGLEVHFQLCLITGSKYISEFTPAPNGSPNSFDNSFQGDLSVQTITVW
jgi:hypothetical protein